MTDPNKARIGDIIDIRPDGSYIYMSHRGVMNLDNAKELELAKRLDDDFLKLEPSQDIRTC